jgi:O-antigen/teichoic acid export membrane protein
MKRKSKIVPASGVKLDLLANFSGIGWSALAQIVCVPIFIKFLGIEAFGLLAFYLVLQALLQVLDFGLSPTLTRELARYSVHPEQAAEARDLVRTLEAGYWMIGLLIGAGVVIAAPWLAVHWIRAGAIPVQSVMHAVMLMGILTLFQWPVSFYQGGLMGLRKQLLLNALRAGAATLINLGGVLILWRVSPTVQALLLWQGSVSAVFVTALGIFLWRSLPAAGRIARFDLRTARHVRRFAVGMTGIAVISLILTQADKLFVSKLFSLRALGCYSLAWSVASGPLIVAGCVFNVLFPRMSAAVSAGAKNAVSRSYHRGAQLMAVLILPTAAIVCLFPFEILRLWTGNSETAASAAPIVRVMMAGSAINALLYLPYSLQLAYGWTKLPLAAGLIAISILIPLLFPMAKYFGLVGAASIWVMLNILNLAIVVPIMHRRLLPGETWRYYSDVGWPLLGAVATTAIGRMVCIKLDSPLPTIVALAGLWLASVAGAVAAAPLIRATVWHHFSKVSLLYA